MGSDKAVRLAMYLDEHLRDAEAELTRLGQEKRGLEGRLEALEAKIQVASVKENAARMRERRVQLASQIQRLETNLECPICTETASTPIYQCTEGHLVCSSCEARVGKCALCRQNCRGLSIRNRYAEKDSEELGRLIAERSRVM